MSPNKTTILEMLRMGLVQPILEIKTVDQVQFLAENDQLYSEQSFRVFFFKVMLPKFINLVIK